MASDYGAEALRVCYHPGLFRASCQKRECTPGPPLSAASGLL